MEMIFLAVLALVGQTSGRAVSLHAHLPVHGTLHKDVLYGFFDGRYDGQLVAIPIKNTGKKPYKKYDPWTPLGGGDSYRHYIKYNSLWISLGNLVVRFTNNVRVAVFLFPTQRTLLKNAATHVLANPACPVE